MYLSTILIVSLLAIHPAFTAPAPIFNSGGVDSNSLVARDTAQRHLYARSEGPYGIDLDMMEKRDLVDEETLVELVVRSPEPEPLPESLPALNEEDMARRGIFGFALKAFKGIAKGVSAIKKAHSAKHHYDNHRNRHHKRSWKSFWRKVGVMRRNDQDAVAAAPLKARSLEEPEFETRSFEEPQLETRDAKDLVELEARDNKEPMELENRDFEESIELEARDFDEVEIEARDVEEPMELEARDVEETVELEARDIDEPMELEARDFEEEES
ncbi:hypothetical protein CPB86DRAFT_782961 [Serendipita vermifera]|nr:hypothetical protein CPB86DRAFT_782961 [Serendipita vermifera]